MALSGESVESLVKPELREAFEADKANWFPRTDTPEHRAYDKRKPGLFKEDWKRDGMIGLCSKTYYCFGTKDKFSCKGVNKRLNAKYLEVLLTQRPSSGVNCGFRTVNNTVYTQSSERRLFVLLSQTKSVGRRCEHRNSGHLKLRGVRAGHQLLCADVKTE